MLLDADSGEGYRHINMHTHIYISIYNHINNCIDNSELDNYFI